MQHVQRIRHTYFSVTCSACLFATVEHTHVAGRRGSISCLFLHNVLYSAHMGHSDIVEYVRGEVGIAIDRLWLGACFGIAKRHGEVVNGVFRGVSHYYYGILHSESHFR